MKFNKYKPYISLYTVYENPKSFVATKSIALIQVGGFEAEVEDLFVGERLYWARKIEFPSAPNASET